MSKKSLERDEVAAALHGSAGHHLRPAQGAAADVQRHGGHVDHVLRPDERPAQASNSKYSTNFAFAAPPAVFDGGKQYGALSVDGWSLPKNTTISPDLLFQLIAASVSEDASKSAVPAAYPAREGIATRQHRRTPRLPTRRSKLNAPAPQPYPTAGHQGRKPGHRQGGHGPVRRRRAPGDAEDRRKVLAKQ